MRRFPVLIVTELVTSTAVTGMWRKTMSDRLRIRDGLRGRRHVVEVSPAFYKELFDKLIEAGYDWLIWPDLGQIPMDGFVIRSVERGQSR